MRNFLNNLREAALWCLSRLWSWPVIGVGTTAIYGLGVAALFGDEHIIAATMFFISLAWLIGKLAAWEEVRNHEHAQYVRALVVLAGVVLFVFSLLWDNHQKPTMEAAVQVGPPPNLPALQPKPEEKKSPPTVLPEVPPKLSNSVIQKQLPTKNTRLLETKGRHILDLSDQEKFKKGLAALAGSSKTVTLSCPTADEAVCIYAAQYIDIFKSVGWTVEGGIVHRFTLGIPFSGIRLFTYSEYKFDPAQPAGTGHWLKMTPSLASIEQAFFDIGLGTDVGGESDLSGETVNVYFGPEKSPEEEAETLRRNAVQIANYKKAMAMENLPKRQ